MCEVSRYQAPKKAEQFSCVHFLVKPKSDQTQLTNITKDKGFFSHITDLALVTSPVFRIVCKFVHAEHHRAPTSIFFHSSPFNMWNLSSCEVSSSLI